MRKPPEDACWLTVKDFVDHIGVSTDLYSTLNAIDKYNTHAVDVLVHGHWISPGADQRTSVDGSAIIEQIKVRGIAWDGSDWEWGKCTSGKGPIEAALTRFEGLCEEFEAALEEYEAERDAESQDGY